MSQTYTRRQFLKLMGLGTAAAAVLTGCGPAARYVTRRPYANMPEYNQTGVSTYYATGCRECPAACGLIVRTQEGRAIKVEGNPQHPVNRGKVCPRGLTSIQGLYNPDRIQSPRKNAKRGGEAFDLLDWTSAINLVKTALADASSTCFLLGGGPDHLNDLVDELGVQKVRCSTYATLDGRATFNQVMGSGLPYYDLAEADVVFSFGANFLETWLSPLQYSRGYGTLRQGHFGRRGYFVSFEPRLSLTSANADEWIPVRPGTEGLAALALGALVARRQGGSSSIFTGVDYAEAARAAEIPLATIAHLADLFLQAERPLAMAGGGVTAHAHGKAGAQTVLALNALANPATQTGGLLASYDEAGIHSLKQVQELVTKMNAGAVKTLLIHGVNPIFELPAALGFQAALDKVQTVISFASFPDETALASDYVLPDHTPLESWGYQNAIGADRPILTGFQPVVVPLYDTRSTVDVLLAASGLPYKDEVDFIQQHLLPYLGLSGLYTAPDLFTFASKFQQYGGWWPEASLNPASLAGQTAALSPTDVPELPEGKFHLVVYPTQMGDGSGANRPWLQETPDPMTTVMWRPWIEIHPETAHELGVTDDDIVLIKSAAGEMEAVVYQYPAIRPDTVALPFGQGHTALGRYAQGRGANPAQLLEIIFNEAGDLAYGDTLVSISATGRKQPLARLESKAGVYGEH